MMQPERISWDNAVDTVLSRAGDRAMIGITGPVGAGKSTLAERLRASHSSALVLSTDRYLPDYHQYPMPEWDRPERADLAGLASHLRELAQGRTAEVPVWSFHEHRRIGTEPAHPADLVICEGIHALHASVRAHLDVRVFVEAPAHVRWSRWERNEAAGERGWGVQRAREFFEEVAEPVFARHASDYRRAAHLVVVNDEHKAT